MPPVFGDLLVQLQALLFQRFETFFQRRAGEFAHHLLERAPRLPVAAPEISVKHRFDATQSHLGVPYQHQGLASFALPFFDALPLDRRHSHHHDSHHGNQRGGAVEENQCRVDLVGQHDAVEISGREQHQSCNSAPEAGSIRVFHYWYPHDQRVPGSMSSPSDLIKSKHSNGLRVCRGWRLAFVRFPSHRPTPGTNRSGSRQPGCWLRPVVPVRRYKCA
ncbi:hypothetical protein D3C84_830210 [compost metagenome]